MKIITTSFLSFISLWSFGQYSYTVIDQNNVAAVVTDGGILFNNQPVGQPGYEVPIGAGTNAIYAASMWFGGIDSNGQLRLSGATYQNSMDIFPGPYTTDTAQYNSSAYMSQYATALWTVSRSEIENHILNWSQPGYVMPTSISNWPGNGDVSIGVAAQLAPYVDLNGNQIYEPALGDYPNIRGDKTVYVIMNDARSPHSSSSGEVMHIEVHQMIYQYSTNDYLNDLTFVNTRVFNRGNYAYQNFKTSFYADADLGNYQDDYVGCDSLRNMIFTYNGDGFDESNGGMPGFQADPPAIGIKSLNTKMTSATYYTNVVAFPQSDPNIAAQYWNFMNGYWSDGTPMVFGGTGFPGSVGSTNMVTSYMLSGDPLGLTTPVTPWNWTEMNTDNNSNLNMPGDRRMVMSMDSVQFLPGDQICYDYAVIYGPGTPGIIPSGILTLQERADSVQLWYDSQNFDCQQVTLNLKENKIANTIVYPNPSSGQFYVELEGEFGVVVLSVYDLLGRTVFEKTYNGDEMIFDLSQTPGAYLLKLSTDNGSFTQRIVVK